MNENIKYKLRGQVLAHGNSICKSSLSFESFARSFPSDYSKEMFVLLHCVKERLVEKLFSAQDDNYKEIHSRLSQHLEISFGFTSDIAAWAIETWAFAIGLIDESGNMIDRVGLKILKRFSYSYFNNREIRLVCQNDKYGLMDMTSKQILINPEFDRQEDLKPCSCTKSYYDDENIRLAKWKKGDKYGYINEHGILVIKPHYDEVLSFERFRYNKEEFTRSSTEEVYLCKVQKNGKYGYLAYFPSSQKTISAISPQFQNIGTPQLINNSKIFVVSVQQNGKWQFIQVNIHSPDHITKISSEYDLVHDFTKINFSYIAKTRRDGRWGYVIYDNRTNSTKPLLEHIYLNIDLFELNSTYLFKVSIDDKYGFLVLDSNCKDLIKLTDITYTDVSNFHSHGGLYYAVFTIDNKYGYLVYNPSSKRITHLIPPIYDKISDFKSYGEINRGYDELAITRQNNRYGIIDIKGNIVIEPTFPSINKMTKSTSSSFTWLKIEVQGRNKYLIIDSFNKAKFIVDEIKVSDGAIIKIKNTYGLIDRNLNFKLEANYDEISTGYGSIYYMKKNDKIGFLNWSKSILIEPKYGHIDMFNEGSARISLNEKWGLIDHEGKHLLEPTFEYIGDFEKGAAQISLNGKVGLIDNRGSYILKPDFDDISPFNKDNRAKVILDNKVGLIDRDGNFIVRPDFQDISYITLPKEKRIKVKVDSKWALLNEDGSLVHGIEFQFDTITHISEYFSVILDEGYYQFVTRKNNTLVKAYFDSFILTDLCYDDVGLVAIAHRDDTPYAVRLTSRKTIDYDVIKEMKKIQYKGKFYYITPHGNMYPCK